MAGLSTVQPRHGALVPGACRGHVFADCGREHQPAVDAVLAPRALAAFGLVAALLRIKRSLLHRCPGREPVGEAVQVADRERDESLAPAGGSGPDAARD